MTKKIVKFWTFLTKYITHNYRNIYFVRNVQNLTKIVCTLKVIYNLSSR